MMKLSILFLGIFAASLSSVKAVSKDEVHMMEETLLQYFHECNKPYGISDEDLKVAKEQKNINALDPCLISCVLKKAHMINDKGLFVEKKLIEDAKKNLQSEEDQMKAVEIINSCLSVNDAEVSDGEQGCERAKLLFICFIKRKNEFLAPPSA